MWNMVLLESTSAIIKAFPLLNIDNNLPSGSKSRLAIHSGWIWHLNRVHWRIITFWKCILPLRLAKQYKVGTRIWKILYFTKEMIWNFFLNWHGCNEVPFRIVSDFAMSSFLEKNERLKQFHLYPAGFTTTYLLTFKHFLDVAFRNVKYCKTSSYWSRVIQGN